MLNFSIMNILLNQETISFFHQLQLPLEINIKAEIHLVGPAFDKIVSKLI